MSERVPAYIKVAAGLIVISATSLMGFKKIGEMQPNNLFLYDCRNKNLTYDICLGSDTTSITLVKNQNLTSFPSWSLDGNSFVYSATNKLTNKSGIFKKDILGNPTLLFKEGFAFNPEWVTSGPYKDKILITAGGFDTKNESHAYLIDPSRLNIASDLKEVDLGREFNELQKVKISPDGQTLAIETYEQSVQGNMLWIKKIGSNEETREVMPVSGDDSIPFSSFSPDGKKIAFVQYIKAGALGEYLWIRNINSGELINLNIQTADFSWSPDGKQITYSWNYGIFKINIDSGKVERLTSNKNNSDMAPMWSKDGKIYYNESTDTHKLVLRKMDPDGSKNEVVSVIDWDTTKGFSPQKILFAPQK